MNRFVPKYYIQNFTQLNPIMLKEKGIKILLIDVDNTIIKHYSFEVSDEVKNWVEETKTAQILPILISNNKESRIKNIAKQLNVDYMAFSCKPLKRKYKKVIKEYSCSRTEVAALGDQLVTDILGANRMGIVSILQDPLECKENSAGKITRFIEKKIMKRLEAKGQLRRGEYYNEM